MFRLRAGHVAVLALLLALPAAVVGAQGQQRPTFDATVSRVRVDVIVTDGEGRFVNDLGPDDFVVYEDGVRQEVIDVHLVDRLESGDRGISSTSMARARDRRTTGAEDALPPRTNAAAPRGRVGDRATAAEAVGAIVFLIDGPSLAANTKLRFTRAWKELLAGTERAGVPRAAYLIGSTGRVRELAALTEDLDRLRAAAEEVEAQALSGERVLDRIIELAEDLDSGGAGVGAKVKALEHEARAKSLATYEMLTQFCNGLAALDGRTALVWVSEGVKLMQGGPYTAILHAGGQSPAFDLMSPDPAIRRAEESLHRAANTANVSIYGVDPTLGAQLREPAVYLGAQVRSDSAADRLRDFRFEAAWDGLRDSLRRAAEETGGRSFIAWADLGRALAEVEAEAGRYYLLTYINPREEGDGEYHEIRVEVARKGVRVRARRGYVDLPSAERRERRVAAALALPGTVDDLPVEAEALRSWSADGLPQVQLAVAVPFSQVGLADEPGAPPVSRLEVHVMVVRDGDIAAEVHDGITATAASQAPSRPRQGFLVHRTDLDLDPGLHDVRVAVFDQISERIGARRLELEVEARNGGWQASDLVLVGAAGEGRLEPVVGGRVTHGRRISAYVEVHGGQQPLMAGQLFEIPQGEEPVTRNSEIPPAPLRRAGDGIHRGALSLPFRLPPGRYTLQVVVWDEPAGEHRIFRRQLEVGK